MRVGNEEDDSFDLDLLTHINTALYILRQHNVGDTVTLSIVRDNMQQDITVTLTESTASNNSTPDQQQK